MEFPIGTHEAAAAWWPAPVARGPVDAQITVPGSKSLANRALLIAALADSPSTITGLPTGARDLALMIAALRALGCQITADADAPADAADAADPADDHAAASGAVRVAPAAASIPARVDCGLAGTVMRFVPPVAALGEVPVAFDGDPRARERPMGPMIQALRTLGVSIDDGGRGSLPFTVTGTGSVPGGEVIIDATGSSQFVSALLLVGARLESGVLVRHRGGPVPSLPHIDMTVRMLQDAGVSVSADVTDRTDAWWQVSPGPIAPGDRHVEPDLSNALPFVALAIATGGTVTIADWPQHSLQPDARAVLSEIGARFEAVPAGMRVQGSGTPRGIDVDLRDLGELVPSIAALCALATTPSRLRGIAHLAGHETDRLRALATEITRLGGRVSADGDGLRFEPAALHGADWHTYADHRMATCGAILGARVPGVRIQDIATTAKTFPGFGAQWSQAVATAEVGP